MLARDSLARRGSKELDKTNGTVSPRAGCDKHLLSTYHARLHRMLVDHHETLFVKRAPGNLAGNLTRRCCFPAIKILLHRSKLKDQDICALLESR